MFVVAVRSISDNNASPVDHAHGLFGVFAIIIGYIVLMVIGSIILGPIIMKRRARKFDQEETEQKAST
jgi:hypothetical protein